MKWLEWIFARGAIDELRETIEIKDRVIADLTVAHKRLLDEVKSFQRRDTVQRALITSLRDCNRELDERNCQMEGR